MIKRDVASFRAEAHSLPSRTGSEQEAKKGEARQKRLDARPDRLAQPIPTELLVAFPSAQWLLIRRGKRHHALWDV